MPSSVTPNIWKKLQKLEVLAEQGRALSDQMKLLSAEIAEALGGTGSTKKRSAPLNSNTIAGVVSKRKKNLLKKVA